MPDPRRPGGRRRPALQRSDLPATFTPETMRELDLATLRRLSQRNNRILNADEQRDFDLALGEVMREHTDRMQQSLRRFDPDRVEGFDPELRRSYLRTRARLAAQAERARTSFPQLEGELDSPWTEPPPPVGRPPVEGMPVESPDTADDADVEDQADTEEDMSLATFESEIEETSDSLVLLERIASIELQQLEHHRSQALRDVRGVYFAVVVSVAVIVAGVAPLVEADGGDRFLILVWTAALCLTAGLVYAVVRSRQSHTPDPD